MKNTLTNLLSVALLVFVCIGKLEAQNIYLYAGSSAGTGGFAGDGGAPLSAELNAPHGMAFDASGNVYIADYANNRIRKIAGGIITTIAGNGTAGFAGDGGPATAATCEINGPTDVTVTADGTVYFSDNVNNRIRKITTAGIISTVAGNGTAGFAGDGGPASAATCEVNQPIGVVFDKSGNLYIGDQFNNRIRKITPAGIISTFAGSATAGFAGDGTPAIGAELHYPMFLRFDMWGDLFFEDR